VRNLLVFLFLSLIGLSSNAQNSRKLRAYLDSKQFYAPGEGNYLEIYFQFVGTSIEYKGESGGLIGEVAVNLGFYEKDSLILSDAYRLTSPFMKDSIVEDFYDLRRFALNPGNYSLKLELSDMISSNAPVKATIPIVIEEYNESISISDIEIAEIAYKAQGESIFNKSGITIIPRLSTYYPEELHNIPLYFELYNTDLLEDSVCAIKQRLINEQGMELSDYTSYTRHSTGKVLPIFKKVDISKLPTGKYTLSYTLLSRSLIELASQDYEFERSNEIEDYFNTETIVLDPRFQQSITDDSITYYLESLIPISGPAEVKNILATIKTKDLEKQRKHIQAFWLATSPAQPYDGWIKYKLQVQLVERLYSNNFQEGFETDRGRVYLQYGAPTTITAKENSPTEYPYEIWQYNKIKNFSNKRFVFYNPNLVNNTYLLLHSDMIGELKNQGWPQALSKRNTTNGNVDDPNMFNQEHYGGTSNDLFRQY
jgi:GWxTD domain-containing protein